MTKSLRPRRRLLPIAATGLLVVTSLSGCNNRFGVPDPVTEQGDEVLKLWQVSLYAAVALGVLVLGILFYSLIRHRRRSNELPKQTEGNIGLELTYTVIPFILVAALFFYGLKIQDEVTHLTPSTAAAAGEVVPVDITGYQWNWRFKYPQSDVTIDAADSTDIPVLVIPVDRRIRFNLIAVDVNHAFSVPGFLTKRDLIPGVRNEIEVTPHRTGEFLGYCAEYCGYNHSKMNFKVRIVSQTEYDTWIAQEKGTKI